MRVNPTVITLFTALLLASCNIDFSSGDKPLEKGTPVAADETAIDNANKDKNNDGKRFSVTGYPSLSNFNVIVGKGRTLSVHITTEPEGKGKFITSVNMPYGQKANRLYIPEQFTNKDVVVYDNEGNKHAYTEKMTFSYTLDLQVERGQLSKGDYFNSKEEVRVDKAE